jgi:hypothetical protein
LKLQKYDYKVIKLFTEVNDVTAVSDTFRLGANTKVADTYGWELGSDENAILDVILSQYEIRDSGVS